MNEEKVRKLIAEAKEREKERRDKEVLFFREDLESVLSPDLREALEITYGWGVVSPLASFKQDTVTWTIYLAPASSGADSPDQQKKTWQASRTTEAGGRQMLRFNTQDEFLLELGEKAFNIKP